MEKPIFKKPGRGAAPCTGFIYLDGEGGAVQSNPDLTVWRNTEADYHGPAQCVDRGTVSRVLALDPRPVIELGRFIIHKGGRRVVVPFDETLDAEMFPLPDYREDDLTRLALPGFAEAVKKVKYAAAGPDEVRQRLQGVCLSIRGGAVQVAATDGHRAHVVTLPAIAHDDQLDMETIFPLDALPHIATDLLFIDNTHPKKRDRMMRCGDVIIKPLDELYPDYRRIVPGHNDWLACERAELLEWLALWFKTLPNGGKIRDGGQVGYQPITLEWKDGELRAMRTVGNNSRVDLGLSLPVQETMPGSVSVSSKYLIDALRANTARTTEIRFSALHTASSVIHIDREAVVMPVRV